MDSWTRACFAQTGVQNVFEVRGGQRYMWEVSRTEHHDGAITGTVWKMFEDELGASRCRQSGSFRIEGDGTVKRAPAFLKAVR